MTGTHRFDILRRDRSAAPSVVVALAAATLSAGLLVSCGDLDPGVDTPSEPPRISESDPTSMPGSGGTTSPTAPSTVPDSEVWQWAFGESVWEDPLYALSKQQEFSPGSTDITVNTMGFSLTPNEQGDVVIVTLFNQDTGMEAYQGALPGGLDWSTTGSDLLEMLGRESATGPYPTYEFEAATNDGYRLTISTNAMHEEDLLGASITSITVRLANG